MSRPHLSLQVAFQGEIVSLQFDIMMLSMRIAVLCLSVIVYVSTPVGSVGLLKEQTWYPPVKVQLPPQYCRTEIYLSYSFFWVIPRHLIFICRFGTLCPICMGGVSRKNNRDETVGVFIWKKVWLKNSLSQSEGGGTGRGCVQVEKQAVEGKAPKWRPVVSMWGRNDTVRARKGSHGMEEIGLLCFRWPSPFFKLWDILFCYWMKNCYHQD